MWPGLLKVWRSDREECSLDWRRYNAPPIPGRHGLRRPAEKRGDADKLALFYSDSPVCYH